MKIRIGFVSNSSSSSFIFLLSNDLYSKISDDLASHRETKDYLDELIEDRLEWDEEETTISYLKKILSLVNKPPKGYCVRYLDQDYRDQSYTELLLKLGLDIKVLDSDDHGFDFDAIDEAISLQESSAKK